MKLRWLGIAVLLSGLLLLPSGTEAVRCDCTSCPCVDCAFGDCILVYFNANCECTDYGSYCDDEWSCCVTQNC